MMYRVMVVSKGTSLFIERRKRFSNSSIFRAMGAFISSRSFTGNDQGCKSNHKIENFAVSIISYVRFPVRRCGFWSGEKPKAWSLAGNQPAPPSFQVLFLQLHLLRMRVDAACQGGTAEAPVAGIRPQRAGTESEGACG